MKVSVNWLKKYVDIDVTIKELCDRMTMAGFEIEELIDPSDSIKNVVVGKVLAMEPHPDSDHMFICQIDAGKGEPVQIVTGAQNVFTGAFVPAALHDSFLPNGTHIKSGKLRGVQSDGMLCSGGELGLTESDYEGAEVNGIMILHGELTPGTNIIDAVGLDDVLIDFSVTANRPDCQSVMGIAREVAAVLNKPFTEPDLTFKTVGDDISNYISVEVKNFELCPRYYGRIVKNIRIKESPDWLKKCIIAAGMRPINNIVDITNFVMMETGQPMHAFDLRDVMLNKIIVRNALKDERIVTLDGKDHTLSEDMLVIADGVRPSCLAGVMGGMDSEIKNDTPTIFFECAKFKRDNIRRTARKLGIRTESSARFEKGIDIMGTEYAMNRALNLVCELDAGDVVDGFIDVNNGLPAPHIVETTATAVNQLLGLNIPADEMADWLGRVQIKTDVDGDKITCHLPTYREDVEGRADIAEEFIRLYGYEHIEGTPMRGAVNRGKKDSERIINDKLKYILVGDGLREIFTYSFINENEFDRLNLAVNDNRRKAIKIINPLSVDYSTMRTQLVSSMLQVLSTNINRKIESGAFFEFSKLFIADELPLKKQPEERPSICIGMYGEDVDFFVLKGIVEDIVNDFTTKYDCTAANEPYMHPGRTAVLNQGRRILATLGEIHPSVAKNYGINTRVYIAEIDLALLNTIKHKAVTFTPLPKFPAVERDFALICDRDLPVGEIDKTIRKAAGDLLEKVQLFDVYTGEQIESGKKSVAYRVTLRSAKATLTDAEVEKVSETIIGRLSAIGAELRR